MRWDRLFAELEGQVEDLELEERDALVHELRDGEWADTSWRDLVGGRVVLDVVGLGRVEGEVRLVNEHVVHLRSDRGELVIAPTAVLEVVSSARRAEPSSPVTSRLGWRHVLRAARDEGEHVRVIRHDGQSIDGAVEVVGRDFLRLATDTNRMRTVPFDAIAVLTLSAS